MSVLRRKREIRKAFFYDANTWGSMSSTSYFKSEPTRSEPLHLNESDRLLKEIERLRKENFALRREIARIKGCQDVDEGLNA